MQSISLSLASRNRGCSHPRFSSSSSLVMVGKNCIASKNGPSCSTMRWIVALPISILAGKMGLRLRVNLERDGIRSNRHRTLDYLLSMISGQTLRVCPEGKPGPTHRVVARGHAFPDHALATAGCQIGMLQPVRQI